MPPEKLTRGLCNYKIFALGTLNYGQAKKNVKKDKLLLIASLISLKRHTSHNTLLLNIKMFSVTQTVTQSVRLNATVSKRDVTRRYEEVLLVYCVCWIDHPRVNFVLFYLLFSLHVIFSIKRFAFGRAREGERLLHSSQQQTPFAVKASFVPSFRRKERE